MHSNSNENARLAEIVKNFGTPRILVIGDLMLDHYIYGKAGKVSQEAPVMALEWKREEWRLGGAANVALMCKALGAEVTIAGVVGVDMEREELGHQLKNAGICISAVVNDSSRKTTVKHRYIGQSNGSQGQQVLRVDRESQEGISKGIADRMWGEFREGFDEYDVVLISDYGKGVCTEDLMGTVGKMANQRIIPLIADPCRGEWWGKYIRTDAITPNRVEWEHLKANNGGEIEATVFITQDADGIILSYGGETKYFPTRPRTVYDVTGAGDAVLAMIGMCYANRVSPEDAARLANIAGGLEVERLGCVPVTREEVIADLLPFVPAVPSGGHRQSQHVSNGGECTKKSEKKRVVFTNGCFDLLHAGHVAFLEAAKREGDYLIVAVNDDRSAEILKGKGRPIIPLKQRVLMLKSLSCVDEVQVQITLTPHHLLKVFKPDVLVKGEPYKSISEVVGHEIVEAYGGTVKILPGVPGLSTTEILRRIRKCNL